MVKVSIVCLLLSLLTIWSCSVADDSTSIFKKQPFADTTKNKSGELRISDTPRMWESFRESVDFRIQNESAGRRPEGGVPTWNALWLLQIGELKTGRENSQKYINYILSARRQAGLPELIYSDDG